MPDTRFDWIVITLAVAFMAVLVVVAVPTFVDDGLDIVHAVDQAFVNPYSSAFTIDILFTYAIFFAWVVYEAQYRDVRHGWVALVLGLVIGVAVGLASYLLIRHKEIGPQTWR